MNDQQEITAKHLELIQGVINRLAANSFLLKGWTITLVAGLFALAASSQNWRFALIAIMPGLAFWWLDAYYLRQERLFRKVYDSVRLRDKERATAEPNADPYSMETKAFLSDKTVGLVRIAFSPSVLLLHGTVVVTVSIVAAVLKCYPKGG